jgi:hypothetical protein
MKRALLSSTIKQDGTPVHFRLAARVDAGTGQWCVMHSSGTATGTGDPFVYATQF